MSASNKGKPKGFACQTPKPYKRRRKRGVDNLTIAIKDADARGLSYGQLQAQKHNETAQRIKAPSNFYSINELIGGKRGITKCQ